MASSRRNKVEPRQLVKARAFEHHVQNRGVSAATADRIQYTSSVASGPVQQQATVPKLLDAGFEQLYSYYAPSLKSGLHAINVTQTISNPGDPSLSPTATQNFEVVGPRFSLPDGEVRSCYPPQGHGDHLQILPHIVLEDPHLPWERSAVKAVSGTVQQTPNPRHQVPWLALMVFEQSELRLPADTLAGNQKIFMSDTKQSPTWSVNMSIDDLWKMQPKIVTPVQSTSNDPIDSTTSAQKYDFIFLSPELFKAHFQAYDDNGNPVATQTQADVSRYEYLSHVRNINTAGMPDDATGGDDQGLFSVVLAHRTGPWTIQAPTPVSVHLVSIDNVESMLLDTNASYVALSSLYSWTYNCLPVDSFNCYDTMMNLAETVNVLAAPTSLTSSDNLTKTVTQRIADGFTLGIWKVTSGEETMAMWRGPFTPTNVPQHLSQQSTFSADLQLLDPETGIMDISYSIAWQLGKTMAIADQSFTAALSRLRSTIHDQAYQKIKAKIKSLDEISIPSVAASLATHVATLNSDHVSAPDFNGASKWQAKAAVTDPPAGGTGFFSPSVRQDFLAAAIDVVKNNLAGSTDNTPAGHVYYNEHNKPLSNDWALMLDWVLNRLYFYGIPAHYLITDPSVLPKESMRFFLIDPNWTDAYLDGAFSICNHIEGDDDQMRTALMTVLKQYLTTSDPSIGYAPQIPHSGFLLRSSLVKQFPDIIVKADWSNSKQLPIIRQEFLAEDTLLVLFNRVPGDGQLVNVVISQPPHQQCFAAADNVGPSNGMNGLPNDDLLEFEVGYKQIYTDSTNQRTGDLRKEDIFQQTWYRDSTSKTSPIQYYAKSDIRDFSVNPPAWSGLSLVTPTPSNVYDWNTRCLIFPAYARVLTHVLQQHMSITGAYTDTEPNAAVVAIQLNEPMYQFKIDTTTVVSPSATMDATASPQSRISAKALLSRKRTGMTPALPSHLVALVSSDNVPTPSLPESDTTVSSTQKPIVRQPSTPKQATYKSHTRQKSAQKSYTSTSSTPKTGPSKSVTPISSAPKPSTPTMQSKRVAVSRAVVPGITSASDPSRPTLPGRGSTKSAALPLPSSIPLVAGPQTPLFEIRCHPAGSTVDTAIPSGVGYPIDLIFSVRFKGYPDLLRPGGSRLWRLWMVFDLKDNHNMYCLTSHYAGGGGRMLSNLRWNALVEPLGVKGGPATQLQFTLIPRSSTAPPSLSKCLEMGFIVSGVDVNQYAVDQQWTPVVYEQYLTSSGQLTQPKLNKSLTMHLQPMKSSA